MMPRDRMFRVLVLGGVALAGGSCGGSVSVLAEAGAHDGGFPSELPVQSVGSGQADAGADTAFPAETNASTSSDAAAEGGPDAGVVNDAALDAGPDVADAACPPYKMKIGTECFPIEGPPP